MGKQRGKEKKELMREEGHLVVICVYGQMPFLNILDVTSQLWENVDVLITNSGAFVSDAFGAPQRNGQNMQNRWKRLISVTPNSSSTGNLKWGLCLGCRDNFNFRK